MYKILLIEDDLSLSRGLQYTLDKEGFQIDSAASASDGKILYQTNAYELILLDVNLPDGNGFDLFKEFRKKSVIPVIFLTACDEEVNVVMGLDMGADDYIGKPFRINELVSRIRAVLRRSPAVATKGLIRSGIFKLDKGSARLYKNDEALELTQTEFRLISLLMTNESEIVSREILMEQLWDNNEHYVDANTLSVYVRRLREKLEDNPAEPEHIETIRGVGYRWK